MESSKKPSEDPLDWVRKDKRRLLRAIINVGNLDRTIDFYKECFGMKVLKRFDFAEKKYSVAVMGFGPPESHFVIEIRYYRGVDKYEIGTGFAQFGIAVQDVNSILAKVRAKGGTVTREPKTTPGGGGTVFAFVLDPNGYTFELIQGPPTPTPIPIPKPLSQLGFYVANMDRAIKFYQKALGLNLLIPKFDVTDDKYTLVGLGYGKDPTQTTILEFKTDFVPRKYTKGNGYQQLVIGTNDVYKSSKALEIVIKELGGKIIKPPGPIPILNTKIVVFTDPEGWELVLVDNEDYLKDLQKIDHEDYPKDSQKII